MDLIGQCMRCERWFDGDGCPVCDADRPDLKPGRELSPEEVAEALGLGGKEDK